MMTGGIRFFVTRFDRIRRFARLGPRWGPRRPEPQLSLRPERFVDLLLDVVEVLVEHLVFFFGQDPERHPNQSLLELHVQPVLPMLDAARNLEEELTDGGAQ